MSAPPTQHRCEACGARVQRIDRACFACHLPLPPTPAAELTSSPEPEIADLIPPAPRLTVEFRYGRTIHNAVVESSPATIGSTEESDICIPAGFLRPEHAQLRREDNGWILRTLALGASIMHKGVSLTEVGLTPGETYRLGDGVGNFVTLRAQLERTKSLRQGAFRAALPDRGGSFLIGSDPSCSLHLAHPLVQRRHAALRRDESGVLWLEDRATAAGTYVNGRRLQGRTQLAVGDTLQVGPFSATVSGGALEQVSQLPGVDIDVRSASISVGDDRHHRTLLQDVSLHIEPATLTAVIGPSGAGKTTLMRMLAGQLAATQGMVAYDGNDVRLCRESYSELMGFVPQDDVVHVDLTVDEALTYQARLRLGASTTPGQQRRRIDGLTTMLGLGPHSGQLVRTLSGGQRKRVSIACELLKEPQLLFLDEPTSGLDPGLDKRMMLLLRLLADQGRTVLITTHSIAHVSVCDTLVLVGPGGRVVYAGDPDAAGESFGVTSLGDIFSAIETAQDASTAAARHGTPTPLAEQSSQRSAAPTIRSRPPVGSTAWRTAVIAQAKIFAGRQVRLIRRDTAALMYTLIQGAVVALMTAFVAPAPFHWSVNSSSVVFVMGCAAVWFGMIGSVRELVKERPIWRREFMAGGNLVAYLTAKVAVLAGLGLIQSLTLTVVLDLALGLPPSGPLGPAVLTFTLTLWLGNLCGIALGLLVSATAPSADRALSLVPYLLIAQLILAGVLFRLGTMTFLSWFVPARWAVSCLGGAAGLDSATVNQSSGMFPHSGAGLFASWLMLILLAGSAFAATSWSLIRQGRSWQTGSDSARPLLRILSERVRAVERLPHV